MATVAWIANAGYIFGCWSLANRRPRLGQAFNCVSGLAYTAYGINLGVAPLWTLSLFLAALAAYGVWNYRNVDTVERD